MTSIFIIYIHPNYHLSALTTTLRRATMGSIFLSTYRLIAEMERNSSNLKLVNCERVVQGCCRLYVTLIYCVTVDKIVISITSITAVLKALGNNFSSQWNCLPITCKYMNHCRNDFYEICFTENDDDDELDCFMGFYCTITAIKPLSVRGVGRAWAETHADLRKRMVPKTTSIKNVKARSSTP